MKNQFTKQELIYIAEQFADRLKEEAEDKVIKSIVEKTERELN